MLGKRTIARTTQNVPSGRTAISTIPKRYRKRDVHARAEGRRVGAQSAAVLTVR